jgi:undecaprenyl-diphosphatase
MRDTARALITRFRSVEISALMVPFVVGGALWVFLALADEIREGESLAFDRAILLALRNPADLSDPIGPGWFEEAARDVTALGGHAVLTILTLATILWLVMAGKKAAALLVLVSVIGGMLLSTGLKIGFERARPDLVPHGARVYTASFPSGHAMLSAVVYLTLGALLARVQATRRLKAFVLGLAILLTALVGASRVYLGVHWPSDVLAGWSAGAAWAFGCWMLALWLQRRGDVEAQDEAEPKAAASGIS